MVTLTSNQLKNSDGEEMGAGCEPALVDESGGQPVILIHTAFPELTNIFLSAAKNIPTTFPP